MSNILSSLAVGKKTGDDAAEILQAYTATRGLVMVQNHTVEASLDKASRPDGAVDPLPR